jgi:aldose 1-epimerase
VSVRTAAFGQLPGGGPVRLFTLTNARGLIARVTDLGATLTELHVPDRTGRPGDVVLGFDGLARYLAPHPYFGSTVGRVANRIARGRFTLDGTTYQLAANNGPNHLHGGLTGFDKALWRAEALPGGETGVRFAHVSPDGDQGYPGRLDLVVTMRLTDDDGLVIDYRATTDQATPINLTNHAYFNLAGGGDVLGHELWLAAARYTPADETLVPTGDLRPVKGTPLDFTRPTPIGARFDRLPGEPRGYDHNFVIDRTAPGPVLAARVFEPGTGRVMEVITTQPGVQLYTANFLDGTLIGKRGAAYGRYAGFCLETQHFPDSVNHPAFPGTILRPGETYRQTTVYRFSTR